MIAKQFCEICKGFGKVGFTDCGIICEGCYNIEIAKVAYNQGIDSCIKSIKESTFKTISDSIVSDLIKLKKQTYQKDKI